MHHAILAADSNVPPPESKTLAQTGNAMKVGDSLVMSWADACSLRTTMYHTVPGSKWKVLPEGPHTYRIWRMA